MHGKETGDSTGGVIPYKNPPALIAYYLGIFSFFCGPFLGVPAVICGVTGLKRYKANPVIKGVVHAWIGIVLGTGFTLLWLVFALGIITAAATS